MRALGVVAFHPVIGISLQLVERVIQLSPKGARVELVLDGLMEALTDAVGLRALRLGACVLDALQVEI